MENPERWTKLITEKIVSELAALPGKMVRKLKSVLGIGGSDGGGGGDFTFPQRAGLAAAGLPTAGVVPLLASLLERLDRGGSGRGRGPGGGGGPRITFQGGIGTLLERVETNDNVDLP
jgi:hypothetical protein